jgi:hypothetical protein
MNWKAGVPFPAVAEDYSLFDSIHTGSGAYLASYLMSTWGFPRGQRGQSVKLITQLHLVQSEEWWSYTPIRIYIFLLLYLIKRRGKFTFIKPTVAAVVHYWNSKSKSKLYYDQRSVGQPVLVSSTHLVLTTRFLLLSDSCLLMWGALSDKRTGL